MNLSEFYSYSLIGKLTAFLSRASSILAKAAVLRINLNLDGAPITSKSHTHPSHSQTSHLLTSSLSLGVPVPHNKEKKNYRAQ